MNIFATHPDPEISARHHCDVLLRKMVVECAQLLSTAHIVIDRKQVAYKKTHENHPCAIWVQATRDNYRWAFEFYCSMLDEYEFRFGRIHASAQHMTALAKVPRIIYDGMTPFAQAMPVEFMNDNPNFAYRRYLRAKLHEWGTRERVVKTTFTRRAVPLFLHNVAVSLTKEQPAPSSIVELYENLLDTDTL